MQKVQMDPAKRRAKSEELAIIAIGFSSITNFHQSPVLWGEWCRDIANAARAGHAGETARLAETLGRIDTVYCPLQAAIRGFRIAMGLRPANSEEKPASLLAGR